MAGNRWWNREDKPGGDSTPQTAHPSLHGWVQPMPERPPTVVPPIPSYAPAAGPVPTPEPERTPLPETVGIHPRSLIERLALELEADLRAPHYNTRMAQEYGGAVLASLRWALGESQDSPLTHQYFKQPPTRDEIADEDEAATEALRGERKVEGASQNRVSGVEHACMWLRGETDQPPWFWADVESA